MHKSSVLKNINIGIYNIRMSYIVYGIMGTFKYIMNQNNFIQTKIT